MKEVLAQRKNLCDFIFLDPFIRESVYILIELMECGVELGDS